MNQVVLILLKEFQLFKMLKGLKVQRGERKRRSYRNGEDEREERGGKISGWTYFERESFLCTKF